MNPSPVTVTDAFVSGVPSYGFVSVAAVSNSSRGRIVTVACPNAGL